MPEAASLHIQSDATAPVRLVDLTGGSVRLGRGAACDVRLKDAGLADEECRLRRRGDAWQLVPSRASTGVWLDGRKVEGVATLSPGSSFRVGTLTLTLHPAPPAPRPWEAVATPPPAADPPPVRPEPAAAPEPGTTLARPEWGTEADDRGRWLQTHRATKRYEARFRAAGAKLHAGEPRAPRPTPAVRPLALDARPVVPVHAARPTRSVALREGLGRSDATSPAAVTPRGREREPVRPSDWSQSLPASAAPTTPRARPAAGDLVTRLDIIEDPAAVPPAADVGAGGRVDDPDLVTSPVPVGPVTPLESPATAVADAVSETPPADCEDDDEVYRDEPCLTRKLGSTRQVARPQRQRPPAVVDLDVEVIERPPAAVAAEDRPVEDGWAYQTPFVTDTNLAETTGGHSVGPSRPGRAASHATVESPNDARVAQREWPTVGDILAARVPTRAGSGARGRPVPSRRPVPTVAARPGQWRLPWWVGWLPASAAVAAGVGGLVLAWGWSGDNYNAGVVARRLAADEKVEKPLPAGVAPGGGRWWETTAPHLVQWAAYLDKAADDPARAAEARALLFRAAQASPLNPTVRHAVARGLPGDPTPAAHALAHGLGQSRDVLTLSWAGRRLLEAGHKDAALGAYRAALEMAAAVDPTRTEPPSFLDGEQPRRYAVPTEERLAAVVREMADAPGWGYADWSAAVPPRTAAALAVARVLREAGRPDAPAALAAAVAEAEAEPLPPPPPPAAPGDEPAATAAVAPAPADAVRLAAGAAALAMKQRWAEARDRYRRAIDRTADDAARRACWVNVADLSLRLDEDPGRRLALDAAKNADPKDEITRRAVELQKASGVVAQRTGGRGPGGDAAPRR